MDLFEVSQTILQEFEWKVSGFCSASDLVFGNDEGLVSYVRFNNTVKKYS